MNTETGLFTAPFSGTYGFVFYSYLFCGKTSGQLNVDHNGARSAIYRCNSITDKSSSVYFALSLKQGDTVGIFAEYATPHLFSYPAKFTGFLLQKH
jgi:hypothetical protein